jgi:hypothetical protein
MLGALGLEVLFGWIQGTAKQQIRKSSCFLLLTLPIYVAAGLGIFQIATEISDAIMETPTVQFVYTRNSIIHGSIFLAGLAIVLFKSTIRGSKPKATITVILLLMLIDLVSYQKMMGWFVLDNRSRFEGAVKEGHHFQAHRIWQVPYDEKRIERDYAYAPLLWKESYACMHPRKHLFQLKPYAELKKLGDTDLLKEIFSVTSPIVRLVHSPRHMSTEEYMKSLANDRDVASQVVIHEGADRICGASPLNEGTASSIEVDPASGKITEFSSNHVSITVKSAYPVFLYYADAYHPSWQVVLNGNPHTLVRANYAYKGASLPSGENKVEFRFLPKTFLWGLAIHYSIHAVAGFWLLKSLLRAMPPAAPAVSSRTIPIL